MVVSDGVVLGAEKQYAVGTLIMSSGETKTFRVAKNVGVATTGFFADFQNQVRILKANTAIYELETNRPIRVKAAAKLLSTMLYSSSRAPSMMPSYTTPIIGGFEFNEKAGGKLYFLDPMGSLLEDCYTAMATGTQLAIAILEDEFQEGMTTEEGENLVLKSLRIALQRDAASGGGIDILTVTRDRTEVKTHDSR